MTFNFTEKLQSGKDSADAVLNNRKEIKSVFTNLSDSLAQFLEQDVAISLNAEYERGKNIFDSIATGKDIVSLKSVKGKNRVELFKVEQDNNGYPITIIYQKRVYLAYSKVELEEMLGDVVSDPHIHLEMKRLVHSMTSEPEK